MCAKYINCYGFNGVISLGEPNYATHERDMDLQFDILYLNLHLNYVVLKLR